MFKYVQLENVLIHFISHSPDDLIHCIYTLREYIYAAVESKFGERECTNEQG